MYVTFSKTKTTTMQMTEGANLPVLFMIHGGGFTAGTADAGFNPNGVAANLASRGEHVQ